MGVAFGAFQASELYEKIRYECCTNHADQSSLNLSVRTCDGIVIPCVGVGVLDYSQEGGEPLIEVNVLGIPYPLYGDLFPQHVAAYDARFN